MYTRFFVVNAETQQSVARFDIVMPFQVQVGSTMDFTEEDVQILEKRQNFTPGSYQVKNVAYFREFVSNNESKEWVALVALQAQGH